MDHILLFDVDGTLCESAQTIDLKWILLFEKLRQNHTIAILGGGRLEKIRRQLAVVSHCVDVWFAENGLVSQYKNRPVTKHDTIRNNIPDDRLTQLANLLMTYTAQLDLPVKTGNFIDVRDGLIYYVPIGQCCSMDDRQTFVEMDQNNQFRMKVIHDLEPELDNLGLEISLGGQTGMSITPKGWNKTYFTQYYDISCYKSVTFFGDKLEPYGSDHAMSTLDKVKCVSVKSPDDTYQYLTQNCT